MSRRADESLSSGSRCEWSFCLPGQQRRLQRSPCPAAGLPAHSSPTHNMKHIKSFDILLTVVDTFCGGASKIFLIFIVILAI